MCKVNKLENPVLGLAGKCVAGVYQVFVESLAGAFVGKCLAFNYSTGKLSSGAYIQN